MLSPSERDRVELRDGVWLHGVAAGDGSAGPRPAPFNGAATLDASLVRELRRIDAHRPVDLVQLPSPDWAGLAAALDDRFRLVLEVRGAPATRAMGEAVRLACGRARGYLAGSPAAVRETEASCGVRLDRSRLFEAEPDSEAALSALGGFYRRLRS